MPIADDLARIALQEQELQFASFDEETAWRLGAGNRQRADSRSQSPCCLFVKAGKLKLLFLQSDTGEIVGYRHLRLL